MKSIVALFLTAVLAVGCGKTAAISQSRNDLVEPIITSTSTVSNTASQPISKEFVDPQIFRSSDDMPPFDLQGKPLAGVINHHILAADLMARFFKTLKKARPDIQTFIILSPDHFSQGHGISTSQLPYVTPAGDVAVRVPWVKELKRSGVWDGTESRAFEDEHGVGALVPFMAREFPQAQVLLIFLRSDLKPEATEDLGRRLAALADDKTFVVVSSDMSHYLKEADALKRDADTLQWLKHDQWDKLASATDKNTDSAMGFSVLQSYLKTTPLLKGGRGDFVLLSHKISTDYVADKSNTTSYIVGVWE